MFSKQLAMVLQARSASARVHARAVCVLCALMWMTTACAGLSKSASLADMLQRRATVQCSTGEQSVPPMNAHGAPTTKTIATTMPYPVALQPRREARGPFLPKRSGTAASVPQANDVRWRALCVRARAR